MKHLSIRLKITLWFTTALIFVVLFTSFMLLYITHAIGQKEIRDTLISAVDENTVEIEFYRNIDGIDIKSSPDRFVEYNGGYLRIDNDFLDEVNEVFTALYTSSGMFMYGENPIYRESSELSFVDFQIQQKKADGVTYYIFDRKLTDRGLEDLWLRGVVSSERGMAQTNLITRLSLIVMPLLVLCASVGGYLIARNALRPIKQISETADRIGREGNLKERIDLGPGNDELHKLAATFNEMFDKIEKSFETERQFTSDASHELRTPMSVISAQCEYILEKPREKEEYLEALTVIDRQSRKMSKLINSMLSFTRLEVSPDRYKIEAIDLSALLSSLCDDMALIKEKNITLEREIEEGAALQGNSELLTRLFTNIISNAYRYGKKDGYIKVKLKKLEGQIEVTVQDNGIGIAKEEQEKIFRRFYQSDRSRSGEGMGLGLAMASRIAVFHGGKISVQSELGKGSAFKITLPVRKI